MSRNISRRSENLSFRETKVIGGRIVNSKTEKRFFPQSTFYTMLLTPYCHGSPKQMNNLESYLRIARSWSTDKHFIFSLKLRHVINLEHVTMKETR